MEIVRLSQTYVFVHFKDHFPEKKVVRLDSTELIKPDFFDKRLGSNFVICNLA